MFILFHDVRFHSCCTAEIGGNCVWPSRMNRLQILVYLKLDPNHLLATSCLVNYLMTDGDSL
jgi:hypothetical protein